MKSIVHFFLAFLAVAAFQSPCFSSMIKEVTLEELCKTSQDIILAKVVSKESYIKDNNPKRIFTKVTVEINQSFKGNRSTGERIVLHMYGGRYNGFNTFIVGAPNYAVGQETILFLKKYRAASFGDNYGVVGLAQGKFNVSTF